MTIAVTEHRGSRAPLRGLFELAEDSADGIELRDRVWLDRDLT